MDLVGYILASTPKTTFGLFSDTMNWFWTNKEIFKNHPNLQFEEQRFIYRVRKNQYNQWEGFGRWSHLVQGRKRFKYN